MSKADDAYRKAADESIAITRAEEAAAKAERDRVNAILAKSDEEMKSWPDDDTDEGDDDDS